MSCILSIYSNVTLTPDILHVLPNSDISHLSDRRPTTRDKRRFKYKYVDSLRVSDHVMFDLQIR